MNRIIQIVVALFTVVQLNAQELNCSISVNADKVPGSNKQIFTTLQNSLNEFLNQKRWTTINYKPQERINCNITITIHEQNGNEFKANLQIQSSRPVFNSTYLTPVFNFKDDDFSFQYVEFEPLQFSENAFESNLVSVITFYAYVIIGMDADTFALAGGLPFFTKAQDVVILSQQSGYKGWNQNDGSRTRFTLIDNVLSPTYKLFHNSMYDYHLRGLDQMRTDAKKAKENIASSIFTLKSIYDTRPGAFLLRIFMDSKADEIVDVFSEGPNYDTSKLKDDLLRISPINAKKWSAIK